MALSSDVTTNCSTGPHSVNNSVGKGSKIREIGIDVDRIGLKPPEIFINMKADTWDGCYYDREPGPLRKHHHPIVK